MAANTEMSRLDSLPTETLNALLALDTTALAALTENAEALAALAENADALLALLEGETEEQAET